MSHPYRVHLPVNSVEKGGNCGKNDTIADPIKPHQVLANHQLQTRTKKAHPFLQQLPNDVSKSLESLHLSFPQRKYFDLHNDQTPSPRGSTTSSSPVHSLDSINTQSQKSQKSHQSKSCNRSNRSKVVDNEYDSESEIRGYQIKRGSNNKPSLYQSQTSKINSIRQMMISDTVKDTHSHKQKSNGLSIIDHVEAEEDNSTEYDEDINSSNNNTTNNTITTDKSFDIDDYANLSSHDEIKVPEAEELNDSSFSDNLYQLNEKTKSVANLIHPVYKDTTPIDEEPTDNNTKVAISPVKYDNDTSKSNFPNDTTTTQQINVLPLDKSIEMYRQNAKKTKNPEVLFSFAQMLIRTAISKRDDISLKKSEKESYLHEAYNALKKSSKMGYIEAQYYLGDAFSVGLFNKGKPELGKSLSYFEIAGKARHAESAYRTAMCYKKGWGCTRDARKVVKYLEIAAMNNHPVAMMEYGIYAFHGLMSFPEDINTKKKGISWLRRATECATELSCGAPYEMALIYINGFKDIVIKDTNYAIKLLFKASNLGHSKSSSLLGKFYEVGDIVEQNADLSIHFYNISANQGDVDGILGLCSWYFVGSPNLPQDYDEAFAWALRAAEIHHNVKAMLLMERFYQIGVGCEKNLEKSKYWGDLAKKNQDKDNKNNKYKLKIKIK